MNAADPLLRRRPHRPKPALSLWGEVNLPLARAHEVCGRARRTLALHLAAQAGGPVIWIAAAWGGDPLNTCGMAPLMTPQEVIFVAPDRVEDMLWAMEETLRAGCAPVVIADLAEPPGMTAVRRLHLAAEKGAEAAHTRPLGLLLTPGDGGAPGVETRWKMDPAHIPGRDIWILERLRARMVPPKLWRLESGKLHSAADWAEQDPNGPAQDKSQLHKTPPAPVHAATTSHSVRSLG